MAGMSDANSAHNVDADAANNSSSSTSASPIVSLLIKSTGARVVSLAIQGICAILATRMIIGSLGFSEYGYVILVAGIPAILSFMDLGVGAAVTNALSEGGGTDPEDFRRVINTALRTLLIASVGVITFSLGAYAMGLWSRLLSISNSTAFNADQAVTLVLLIFAVTLPLNVGASTLLGTGRNSQLIALRMIQPPTTLLLLWLTIRAHWSANTLPASWQLGTLITALVITFVAERSASVHLFSPIGKLMAFRPLPGTQIRKTALPMFVIMLGLPIALQSDRMILSNRAGLTDVANYSVVATIQTPLMALVAAAGLSLWPHFAHGRGRTELKTDFFQALLLFVSAGFIAGIGLLIFGPILAPFVSKGQATIGLLLFSTAAMVVLVQSAHTPAGMFLTDQAGLTFQAKTVTAMAIVNVGLSWILAGRYGAAGPYLGTAIAIATCQLGPTIWMATSRFRVANPPDEE